MQLQGPEEQEKLCPFVFVGATFLDGVPQRPCPAPWTTGPVGEVLTQGIRFRTIQVCVGIVPVSSLEARPALPFPLHFPSIPWVRSLEPQRPG